MPAKPSKNGRQNYDWGAMKAEYISDPQSSLRKIAEKYGVNRSAVGNKAKAENWFATKTEHQSRIVDETVTEVGLRHKDALKQELESVMNISDRISSVLKEDPAQFNRYVTQTEKPEILTSGKVSRVGVYKYVEERILQKVDTKAVKDMVQSLKMIEDMKRSMLEIQTANERQKLELERERLELEKERIALERERNALRNGNIGSDNDKHYGVVLIPEVLSNE